jgi:hypothetical protein
MPQYLGCIDKLSIRSFDMVAEQMVAEQTLLNECHPERSFAAFLRQTESKDLRFLQDAIPGDRCGGEKNADPSTTLPAVASLRMTPVFGKTTVALLRMTRC